MMKKENWSLYACLFAIGMIISSCNSEGREKQVDPERKEVVSIDANTTVAYQRVEHFGASDAWSCQFVGLWPEEKKRNIAELLFSQQRDETGQPKGIGLSLWRFNIGAGSAEQGEQSGIGDEWRRAESFLNSDGTYDWEKQAGQVWFAQAAQEFGVEHLLVFPNSPPVQMTRTGKAYAENGQSNLDFENYDDFGEYLTNVIKGLQEKGLKVDYISPVNEPQWDWSDGGQEGTPFWNNEIAGIARALNDALAAENLETKIDIAEAGKINYLYEQADKEGRGQQVADFFDASSKNYIGDLSHMGNAISGHSYFTTSPYEVAVQLRNKVKTALEGMEGRNFWMSEYCILGDNAGEINGSGRDLGIDPALYMARVIHNDLTVSNASAWHWWLGVSPYDYKDGLVYIDYQKQDGNYYESKMLWALGNYSFFIRPGYQRIETTIAGRSNQSPDLLVSAYQHPDKEEVVYVIINSANKEADVALTLDGSVLEDPKYYITNKDMDLTPVEQEEQSGKLLIPARSIMTIVSKP
ncbi:glycoside hydrolase [Echinicola salinicaeni]|uniref:glycoside hydrolase n=1 Tax=Echinicola salinicaeni TaxID=2762757 RepID=UPI001E49CA91|nr:glycoside hydrolase [Echinicola salinicaeni]